LEIAIVHLIASLAGSFVCEEIPQRQGRDYLKRVGLASEIGIAVVAEINIYSDRAIVQFADEQRLQVFNNLCVGMGAGHGGPPWWQSFYSYYPPMSTNF
jgi:hypothetical protein